MTDALTLTIAGTPQAWARARYIPGRKRPVQAHRNARRWREHVVACARELPRPAWLSGAVRVDILAVFPSKQDRWGAEHTNKPDKDNVEKAILDGLELAGVLPKGDQRVSRGETHKVWGDAGRAVIEIRPATTELHRAAMPEAVSDWLSLAVAAGDARAGTGRKG